MSIFTRNCHRLSTILLSLIFLSCQREYSSESPLFHLLPSEQTGIDFSNTLYEDNQLNIINFEYFYNGAGVAIGDINNDELQDIFFTGNMVPGKLYLNKGNLTFEDITASSGINTSGKWATGVSMVDINQDGFLDIYICFAGPYASEKRKNQFYINQQDGTFLEQAAEMGLDDDGHSTQAAFFDYDRDGDLDAYILTNITDNIGPNVIRPKKVNGESPNNDRLYRNDEGHFKNVSQESGITVEGYGLGIAIRDLNEDQWPDIYISNDYLSNDLLYINNQDGTFSDQAGNYFQHTSYSAMGNDVVDINNDGLQDIITLDMLPPDNKRRKLMINSINYDRHRSEIMTGYTPQYMRNTLQLNRGKTPEGHPAFSEVGQLAGIHSTDWSWSVLGMDLDNDRDRDLLITNGYPRDITNLDFVAYKMSELTRASYNPEMNQAFVSAINNIEGAYLPNYLFENQGNLSFTEQSQSWGFTHPSFSHGAATGDLDNDGDLDLVINNTQDPVFIYENKTNTLKKNHYLRLELQGPAKNRMGLGSKLYVYHDSVMQFTEYSPYRGFQSSVEPFIHFGLGSTTQIDSILIIWPDGKTHKYVDISANQVLQLNYSQEASPIVPPNEGFSKSPLLQVSHISQKISFQHQEQHYADFKIQPLIPHKFSQSGPGMAIGDVNGDQLEDFYIGGAFNQQGEIFLQQPDGTFISHKLAESPAYEEDMGSLLFDADMDGDLDLYVVSGGSEFQEGSPYYRDRLYFNDGNGNFRLNTTSIDQVPSSGSCILGNDYDADGDLDLFIGGKITPNHYPTPGKSMILENEQGKLRDVTSEICPELENLGMVHAALWTDINQDGFADLMVAGEWMPITIFLYENGKLIPQTHNASCTFTHMGKTHSLEQTVGWWNSIAGADFDRDGDTDYILGNLGLNTPLKTSFEAPVSLYVNDFNMDDKQDPVLTYYLQGQEYPFHPKDDMVQQMYTLRKIKPTYTDYATSTWNEIFPTDILEYAQVYRAHIFESVYLENLGNLQFELHPLPIEAQFAPVFGLQILDINQDQYVDILVSGNSYATETMTGRYDALMGQVLLGNGKGEFQPISIQESGFYLPKDGKSLGIIPVAQNPVVLAATNNDSLYAFSHTQNRKLRWLPLSQNITTAYITHQDGMTEKREIHFGNGYLSQNPHGIWVHKDAVQVKIVNSQGNESEIDL